MPQAMELFLMGREESASAVLPGSPCHIAALIWLVTLSPVYSKEEGVNLLVFWSGPVFHKLPGCCFHTGITSNAYSFVVNGSL